MSDVSMILKELQVVIEQAEKSQPSNTRPFITEEMKRDARFSDPFSSSITSLDAMNEVLKIVDESKKDIKPISM